MHDHAFEHGQLVYRGDVVQAQVVTGPHIGHDRDIAIVKSQPFTQHATARGFQHRSVHVGVVQHIAGALGAAAVAGVYTVAAHIHAVGVGHAHAPALRGQQVGNQPHCGGLAVGAGDCHHGNTAVVTGFEEAGHNRLAHRPAFAE